MFLTQAIRGLLIASVLASAPVQAAQSAPTSEVRVRHIAANSDSWNVFKRHIHGANSPAGFQRQKRRMFADAPVLDRRADNSSSASKTQQSQVASSTTAAAGSKATSASKGNGTTTTSSSKKLDGYFYGASSYYLYALPDADRFAVLDALANNGFKVVRIFIGYVGANNKGSTNREVQDRKSGYEDTDSVEGEDTDSVEGEGRQPADLRPWVFCAVEPKEVGTYDDTVLNLIDQLMYDCKVRGLKLMIALSDRYQLGFWGTDAYALQLNIVKPGSSGVQKVANAAAYYTSEWASRALDTRMRHILAHRNPLFGSRTWAELDEVVYAFEAQNEPQGHMTMASPTWVCDRSAYIKSLLPGGSSIQVSSGGGITIEASLGGWATSCASIDIISVHDYGTNANTAVQALKGAQQANPGKVVMMGEWGIAGGAKASTIASFVSAFKAAGLPWMYWEITKPGQGAADFEVWTNEGAWGALIGKSYYNDPVKATAAPQATATKATTAAASSAKQQQQTQAQATTSQQAKPTSKAAASAPASAPSSTKAQQKSTSAKASAAATTGTSPKSASNTANANGSSDGKSN